MTRVTVLGGGYIGSALAVRLALLPKFRVRVAGHSRYFGRIYEAAQGAVEFCPGEADDQKFMAEATEGADVIINALGTPGPECDKFCERALISHVCAPEVLSRLFSVNSKAYLVHLSSMAVYAHSLSPTAESVAPQPQSFYGRLKLVGESFAHMSTTRVAVFRLAHVFGYGAGFGHDPAGFVNKVLLAACTQAPVGVTQGTFWDFLTVDDLVQAVTCAIEQDLRGVFNVATSNCSTETVALLIGKAVQQAIGGPLLRTERQLVAPSRCMSTNKLRASSCWRPEQNLARAIYELVDLRAKLEFLG